MGAAQLVRVCPLSAEPRGEGRNGELRAVPKQLSPDRSGLLDGSALLLCPGLHPGGVQGSLKAALFCFVPALKVPPGQNEWESGSSASTPSLSLLAD